MLKLSDALRIIRDNNARDMAALNAFLVCGFTPGPLSQYLLAHLATARPTRHLVLDVGPYGDIPAGFASPALSRADVGIVLIEWPDIDPRLGYRRCGGWSIRQLDGLLADAEARLGQLAALVQQAAAGRPIVLSLPSLPLPPLFQPPGCQMGAPEAHLRHLVAGFAARCAAMPGVRLLNADALDALSPPALREDVGATLAIDFPYQSAHGQVLARLLAELALPPPPLKGIITDLDDTFWRGLVGEVGPDAVHWTLEQGSQVHAVYQQMLAAFADAGVLIGVASKNDAAVVAQALARDDLLIPASKLFPVVANWGPKSASVASILQTWNIGADAVMFIDDNPMELEEVRASFPAIATAPFPTNEPPAVLALLRELQSRFGRDQVSDEDRMRADSLRQGSQMRLEQTGADPEVFLQNLAAELVFDFGQDPADTRPRDLINKTNQFNLNGIRIEETAWRAHLADPASFTMTVSYKDKFGPLGKIAVVAGSATPQGVVVHSWVLSCRAFSRRVEHQTLACLFARFAAPRIEFLWQETAKNGVLGDFLRPLVTDPASAPWSVAAGTVDTLPPLYQRITINDQ